jgi:hypothetical protein
MATTRRNTPALKGMPAQGSRPAGSSTPVANGQYPTVLGTHGLPNVPAPYIQSPGSTTVNSTPAPRKGKKKA